MGWRKRGERAFEGLVIAILVSLLVGAFLGQPVLLSFVESGSMEPTIQEGDGFIAIPAPFTGDVEEGDVIVFEAQALQGGGLTTHRVVDETPEGYITKGDANPFTDQDGQEPPVTDGQIVAKALQVNGDVVVIPGVGTAVQTIRGGYGWLHQFLGGATGSGAFFGAQGGMLLLAGFGLAIIVFGLFTDRSDGQRDRSWTRDRTDMYDPRRFVIALAVLVTVVSGGTMFALSDTHEYGMVSASFDSELPTTVPAGETSNATYPAMNGGQLPVYAFYEPESRHVEVDPAAMKLSRGEQRNATIMFSAPPQTGYYPQFVTEYRYFAVLPMPVIEVLHAVHPWLPILATSAVLGGVFYVVGLALLGRTPVRVRSRKRGRDSWL